MTGSPLDARWLLRVLAVTAAYFVTARIGQQIVMPGGYATPVWPPSGVALAAMFIFGRTMWPGVWLGAFAANLWNLLTAPGEMSLVTSLTLAAGISAGATATAWLGAHLVRRFAGAGNPLDRVRDVCALMGLGGAVSCLLSATNGVLWLEFGGFVPQSTYWSVWLTWWLGDTAGVFVFAPLLLAWLVPPTSRRKVHPVEASVCFAVLLGAGYLIFIDDATSAFSGRHLAFVIIPFLVWPALRLGQRGAATAALATAFLAVWGTTHAQGPFDLSSRNESLLVLELFLSIVALTALCIAALATQKGAAEAGRQLVLDELESRVRMRTAELLTEIAERKQAEESLNLMRFSVDRAGDSVFWVSPDARILYANESACAGRGFSREELLGMTVFDLDPDFQPETWASHWEELKRCGTLTFKSRSRCKDGRVFHVEVNSSYVQTGGREFNFAFVRDITQRKQTEEALHQSEAEFRAMTEASPSGIFVADSKGLTTYTNATLRRLLGIGFQESAGDGWIKSVHPQDRAEFLAKWQEATARRRGFEANVRFVRSDGRTIQTSIKTALMREHDRILGYVGAVEDITERQRTEERVREQAAMLDHAQDAIIVRGFHDQRITFWNKGAEAMYGWMAAEASGKNLGELLCFDAVATDAIQHSLLTTDKWRGESRDKTKSGTKVVVNSRATLVRDAAGEPMSVLLINTDVTEQKALEAQLLRTQRMESIGTLAGGLAHDLNNILAPIMMSVPILRMETTPEQRERSIATIETSAERGSQIISQVLAFGRGLGGEKRPLQLGILIEEMIRIARGTFPKGISIESTIEPGLWPVLGDATQIHQILLNLCINARDAMPGGGRVCISARNLVLDTNFSSMVPGTAPGPHVLLEAKDNGSGIPPEVIERIFDPFFTTKGIGKGTGLGLSTVLGIVKGHNGHITVKSNPSEGTTFQIYLPATMDSGEMQAASGPAAYPPEAHGECVLLVDDEDAVRSAAMTVLEAHGYRVLHAADGIEALAVFAKNSAEIAVVVTDLMMPIMDGTTLMQALRTMQPDLPIIASTARNEKTRMAELKSLNVEAVLNKPYTASVLLHALHKALHHAVNTTTDTP